jgi:hypothetical protein
MKAFVRENWFKTGILVLGFIFILLFGYSQYLATKAHTLEVLSQILHCGSTVSSQETAKTCADRAKDTLVFGGVFWGKIK